MNFSFAQSDSLKRKFIYDFHRYTGTSNNYEILMVYTDSTFKLFSGDDDHNEVLADSGKCVINKEFIITIGTVPDKKRGNTKTQEYVLSEMTVKQYEKELDSKNSKIDLYFHTRMSKKKVWILKKTDMN